MTINVDLSQIPELKELPKVERNEEKGGFAYPTEHIGNIYRYNNKLVFFGERTMEEASIGMINLLVNLIKEATDDNTESIQRIEKVEESLEQLEGSISSSFEDQTAEINNLRKALCSIPKYKEYDDAEINDKINTVNINFRNVLEEMSLLKNEIKKTSSEFANQIEDIKSHIETSSLEFLKQIEDAKNRTDLNEVITNKIDDKLTDVYKNFKAVTGDLVREQVQILENDIRLKSNKLTVSQIAMFKEMGLTIDNVIELKKNNML